MKTTTLLCCTAFLLILGFPPALKAQEKKISKRNIPLPFFDSNRSKAIVEQAQIEREARQLEKEGEFEEAIKKYLEAIQIDRLLDGSDRGRPFASIIAVHQKQGEYEQALEELEYLREEHRAHEPYVDWRQEFIALIEARKTRSNQPVYNHILYLKEKYKNSLPPRHYWFGSTQYTDAIIRLYDHIGDSTGGIAFVDQILAYKKLRPKARNEYLKVREAFAQDKKEGFKGCLDAKPGTVCMGQATQVLIQSDYFPW